MRLIKYCSSTLISSFFCLFCLFWSRDVVADDETAGSRDYEVPESPSRLLAGNPLPLRVILLSRTDDAEVDDVTFSFRADDVIALALPAASKRVELDADAFCASNRVDEDAFLSSRLFC